MVYVFCARGDERICFSMSDDISAIPRPANAEVWRVLFRIPKSVSAIEAFHVDGQTTLAELSSRGFYVAKPSATVLPFRKALSNEG
jgi:hypothetical protein